MTQENERSAGLVQIESSKGVVPSGEAGGAPLPVLRIPQLNEGQIYQKKAYIGFRKLIGFTYTKHSYGATRRWVLAKVLPDKILYRWKPYQRGGCNRCGLCCKIVFRCPFFYEGDGTTACMIYTSEKHAPPPCVVFPIDPQDLAEVQREVAPAPCPFYFEGQPEHPTTWGAVKAEIRAELNKRVDKLKEAFNF
ncbi:MAG: hypothetical protein SF339_02745 [Blastocatellia bacterium]|nr:hypothetical protein [Blastocatellia bacterium]